MDTSEKIYCPYCLTYYNSSEYHVCKNDYNTSWNHCRKCGMYYMNDEKHSCPNKTIDVKLDNIESLLKELIGLLKDK